MYGIPDAASASLAEEARLKSGHFDALARGIDGQGVITGCAVTAAGGTMVVNVAAGIVQGNTPSITHEVQATSLTIGAASASFRIDLITVDTTTGIPAITVGTAGTTPLMPAVPAASVVLAAVYVDTTTSTIAASNIIDMRVNVLTSNWVDVRDYGARGDVRKYSDGVATATSTTFTSATASFTAADKGKTISIGGAGTGGAIHVTTIASVTNSTTVVLSLAAVTTVASGALFGFGTDDTTAIQSAITAMNARSANGGGVVFFPPGIYGTTSAVLAKHYVVCRGAGMDVSTVYSLGEGYCVFEQPDGTFPSATGTYFGLEDITVWGPGDRHPVQDSGQNRPVRLRSEKIWCKRVHVLYSRQMSMTGVGSFEAKAENCIVEWGLRDGINFTGSRKYTVIGNTIRGCSDDAIACHIEANLPSNTVTTPSFVCVGNRIEHGSGIKFLGGTNATIVGNSGRFLAGYGIFVDFDASFGEGNKDTIGVTITGNSFMDWWNLQALGGGDLGAAIYVSSPLPSKGTGRTQTGISATASNATVNSTSAVTGDVGRDITIPGAGVSGAALTATIDSVVAGTSWHLMTAPSTTVSGQTVTLSALNYVPGMTVTGTGSAAIKGPATNAWNGISGPATGGYALVIANNTCMQTLDGQYLASSTATAGTAATKFSDYGFGNTWWTAGSQDLTSWYGNVWNAINGSNSQTTHGIRLVNGAQRDALIIGNTIYGPKVAIQCDTMPYNPRARISNNKMTRVAQGVAIICPANVYGEWIVEGNDFDLDPLFEASERTTATGQPTGTWTRSSGGTACCVYTYQAHGVYVSGNTIRNACNITTASNDDGYVVGNYIFADTSTTAPSTGGVGLRDTETAQNDIIQVIVDPRSTTYNQIRAGYNKSATAMPSTGVWAKGTFIRNETPSVSNGVVVMGWLRLTNGSANAENTDWAVIGSTVKTNTTTTPTAAAVAGSGNAGTTPPAPVVTSGDNALRGRITFGTGSTTTGTGTYVTVTFGTAFATAPMTVMLTPSNQATAVKQPYLNGAPSTTAFNIGLAVAGATSQANTVYSVDYLVVP